MYCSACRVQPWLMNPGLCTVSALKIHVQRGHVKTLDSEYMASARKMTPPYQ